MKANLLKNDIIVALINKANESTLLEKQKIYSEVFLGTKVLSEMHAKKWKGYSSYRDLVLVGNLALYNAIITFDPNKCPRFYGWAVPWIKKDLARETFEIKKYNILVDEASDYYKIALDYTDELNPESILIAKEKTNILKKSILSLDKTAARLLAVQFEIDGLRLGQHDAGLSDYQKSRIKKSAFKQLKEDSQLCGAVE